MITSERRLLYHRILDIHWNIQPHRSFSSRRCQKNSLIQMIGNILCLINRLRILCDRLHDRLNVRLLNPDIAQRQSGSLDRLLIDLLPGNDNQRNTILPCMQNACQRVGSCTAGCDKSSSHSSAIVRISQRRHSNGLLMVHGDTFYVLASAKRIGQIKALSA